MLPHELHRVAAVLDRPQGRFWQLTLEPEATLRDILQELGLSSETDSELSFLGNLFMAHATVLAELDIMWQSHARTRIDESIGKMRKAYQLTLVMLNVMFACGVLLLAAGIVIAFQGRSLAGFALGGVGLADLVFFLISKPIDEVAKGIGDLLQLRTVYNSYSAQMQQWQNYFDWQNDAKSIESKQQVSDIIHFNTVKSLDLIQHYFDPQLPSIDVH